MDRLRACRHGKNVEAKPEAAHGQNYSHPLDHKTQNNDAHPNVHACCCSAAAPPAFLLFLTPTTLWTCVHAFALHFQFCQITEPSFVISFDFQINKTKEKQRAMGQTGMDHLGHLGYPMRQTCPGEVVLFWVWRNCFIYIYIYMFGNLDDQ